MRSILDAISLALIVVLLVIAWPWLKDDNDEE